MMSTRHLLYRFTVAALGGIALSFVHATETATPRMAIYLPAERAQADTAAIANALKEQGFTTILLERHGDSTADFARRVARTVRDLRQQGTAPGDISVIGAGIGSETAILASSLVADRAVSYVLLGQCDWHLQDDYRFRMSGRVLGIHDASDRSSHSCRPLWSGAPNVSDRRELITDTGLGAALFDKPRDAWMQPAIAWAAHGRVDVGALRVGQR